MNGQFRGHKTLLDGTHVQLTSEEAEALWKESEKQVSDRTAKLPDEQSALNAMFEAQQRLKELGWRDGIYCPKDGTHFQAIELGSTGIFDCKCDGEWPHCTWTVYDERDAYPSSQAPELFRLYPNESQGKIK